MSKVAMPGIPVSGNPNPFSPAAPSVPDFRQLLQQMLAGQNGLLGGNFAQDAYNQIGPFSQQALQMSQFGPQGNFVGPMVPPQMAFAPSASPIFGGGGGPRARLMRGLLA